MNPLENMIFFIRAKKQIHFSSLIGTEKCNGKVLISSQEETHSLSCNQVSERDGEKQSN